MEDHDAVDIHACGGWHGSAGAGAHARQAANIQSEKAAEGSIEQGGSISVSDLVVTAVSNPGTQLTRDPSQITTSANIDSYFGGTGYRYAAYTLPRQFGVSVRYAFGGAD